MSKFTEWEQWLKEERALKLAQIEAEHEAAVARANLKRAEKRLKLMKKARPPMFVPDRPVSYKITVTLAVRMVVNGVTGELEEFTVIVETMSEVEAELQAKREAQALGFLWRGVISTVRQS